MLEIVNNKDSKKLNKSWKKIITVGRAYELLRSDLLTHLEKAQREIGYEYIRFHGLFHDDMAVYHEDSNGNPIYQWHQVDKVCDSLLAIGLRPFMELNPMPAAMASGEQTMFWWRMNVTPPSSFEKWGALVAAYVEHIVERYGEEEIKNWFFEVWNEPNLNGFWSGTKEEYYQLYESAVNAIKKVNREFQVGGPATSKCEWVTEFIEHCSAGTIPLDFVSTHLYPQDEYVTYPRRKGSPHEPGMFFIDKLVELKKNIVASSMPDIKLYFTEWNPMSAGPEKPVDWTTNPDEDTLYGAAQVIRLSIALDEVVDGFGYWTVSDVFEEGGVPGYPYNCNYGLLTIHGIEKAVYNAFKFMNKLDGDILNLKFTSDTPPLCGAVATRELGKTRVLLWNFHAYEYPEQPEWSDDISIKLDADFASVDYNRIEMRICESAGSSYECWQKMGKPVNLSPTEEEVLKARALPATSVKHMEPEDGFLKFSVNLKPKEILYIELSPRKASVLAESLSAEQSDWDEKMGVEK